MNSLTGKKKKNESLLSELFPGQQDLQIRDNTESRGGAHDKERCSH